MPRMRGRDAMSWVVGEDRETGKTHVLGRPQGYDSTEPVPEKFGKRRKVYRYYSTPPAHITASPFFENIRVVETLPEGSIQ